MQCTHRNFSGAKIVQINEWKIKFIETAKRNSKKRNSNFRIGCQYHQAIQLSINVLFCFFIYRVYCCELNAFFECTTVNGIKKEKKSVELIYSHWGKKSRFVWCKTSTLFATMILCRWSFSFGNEVFRIQQVFYLLYVLLKHSRSQMVMFPIDCET